MHRALGKQFDHIVTNPPYYNQKNFRRSINKGDANYETIELKQWIDFCIQSLKKHGKLHLIHLPSRLGDILNALHGQAGKIVITPIYSKKNQNAKRVIVQCEKGSQSDTVITSNIVVHNTDGGYTDTVKSFLLNCGRE